MSTVFNNLYNQGALEGRYSLKDLSNSGKFSNYVNKIPRRIKFEIDGSNLILKKGSSCPMFNIAQTTAGIMDDLFRITEDLSVNVGHIINDDEVADDPNDFKYVWVDTERTQLVVGTGVTTKPATEGKLYYNTNTLFFENYAGNGMKRCTFPLGYFDGNYNFTPFYSFGFFLTKFFVNPGVELCIADGLDFFSNFNNDITTFRKSVISSIPVSVNLDEGTLIVKKDGSIDIASRIVRGNLNTELAPNSREFLYDENNNILYNNSKVKVNGVAFCTLSLADGYIKHVASVNTTSVSPSASAGNDEALWEQFYTKLLEVANEI